MIVAKKNNFSFRHIQGYQVYG